MREPSPCAFLIAAGVWLMAIQTPFMILIGNQWLFDSLPRNVAILCGLYAIAIPYLIGGAAYFLASRLHKSKAKKEPTHV